MISHLSSSWKPQRSTGLYRCDVSKKLFPWGDSPSRHASKRSDIDGGEAHTGRKALLELLGLVGVLQDKGVEVLLAADLELDVVGLLALLDARGCEYLVRGVVP
jgi:hypothetical protein